MKPSDYILIAGGVAVLAVGVWSITIGPLKEAFDFFKVGAAPIGASITPDPTPTTAAAPAPEIKAMYARRYY